jgi:N-acetylglucosamine kinase-like BadF-type ATPase
LTTLLRELTARDGVDRVDAVCLGTAGSGSAAADAALRETVSAAVTADAVVVVNDAELLLPAAGHDDGVAVVSGTGMKIFGRYGTRRAMAGGWGYLLGDEGSGYWIVREALRVVLDRVDSGAGVGELGSRLFEVLGIDNAEDLIERFHADPAPGGWAGHVPLVLAADDPARDELIRSAAAHLARRVRQVLRRLDGADDLPVVCAGGVLTGSPALVDALTTDLHKSHPRLHVETLHDEPVAGAVRRALQACDD